MIGITDEEWTRPELSGYITDDKTIISNFIFVICCTFCYNTVKSVESGFKLLLGGIPL